MRVNTTIMLALFTFAGGGSMAQAATYSVALSGDVSTFQVSNFPFNGQTYDEYSLNLTGLDSSDSITVSQGDTIDATVTLSSAYTIPASMARTDFLLELTGSSFPSENTGVAGTFTLFDGDTQVGQFGYGSTTSDQLSNYAAILPPENGAYTITSFTDDFTIGQLTMSATLDGSNFTYALVSNGVPEPISWATMLVGLAAVGGMARSRRQARVTLA